MTNQPLYRILTPDGRLSQDVFWVAVPQPDGILSHCVLVVNDRDGAQLTVHRARLLPITLAEPKRACLKCGRVLGVVNDQVKCPCDQREPCELLEPPGDLPSDQMCAEHPS